MKSILQRLAILGLLLLAMPLQAITMANVTFPDTWRTGDTTLVRNGVGVREYSFLRIKVYAAALYLPVPLHQAQAVLDLHGPRVLQMQFLRAASVLDTRKAWLLYLQKNCDVGCSWPALSVQKFLAALPETRRHSRQTYVFEADYVEIFDNDKRLIRLDDPVFSRLLLSTWIGEQPTTEELKRALLGL
ncbi:MAG: chalcone isomerase family protein [Pseudomonadota bacterium]